MESEFITRYVSLEKFLDFVKTKQLFFARFDSFDDKYEGWLLANYVEKYKIKFKKSQSGLMTKVPFTTRRKILYASCWYQGDEQLFMWDRYKNDKGVAIQTSYKPMMADAFRFTHSLHDEGNLESIIDSVYSNPVGYFNPDKFSSEEHFKYMVGLVKHDSFSFENEYRIILRRKIDSPELPFIRWDIPNFEKKWFKVIVNPYASEDYLEMIQHYVDALGHEKITVQPSKYREHFIEPM